MICVLTSVLRHTKHWYTDTQTQSVLQYIQMHYKLNNKNPLFWGHMFPRDLFYFYAFGNAKA